MGGESGNETYIDVLPESATLSPPIFTLIGNDDFYTNLVWKKLVLLSFRGYLGEIESEKAKPWKFSYIFFCNACAVLCQGQRFQFSSPDS